jgi:hypothetical protein
MGETMFKLAAASAFAAGLLAAQSGAFAGEWVWRDTNVPSCKKLVDSGGSGNIWGTVDSAKVVAVKGKCPETIDGMATMQAVLIGSDSVKFLPSGVTCYGEYQKCVVPLRLVPTSTPGCNQVADFWVGVDGQHATVVSGPACPKMLDGKPTIQGRLLTGVDVGLADGRICHHLTGRCQ